MYTVTHIWTNVGDFFTIEGVKTKPMLSHFLAICVWGTIGQKNSVRHQFTTTYHEITNFDQISGHLV